MNTDDTNDSPIEGPAWEIVGRFSTFEKADQKRKELLDEENVQVKIHFQGPRNRKFYALKTRMDPSVAAEEALVLKRAEKKRRKAKLNKKRRKK